SPGATMEQFTLNFTITNLRFTTDLRTPNSAKFNSTTRILQHYNMLFLSLKITQAVLKALGVSSRTHLPFSLRSGRNRETTGINAVCSYRTNNSQAMFDREKVHRELSNMTSGVTKLGHYSLERNSLYVDG
ncbi:MUC16 protein, partial [Turnix velox]|nr:MUC16 protein [Turnix velox]